MEKNSLCLAFTGPESSGKTTMAKWCAQEFSLTCIDEFARVYLANQSSYIQKDLDFMAQEQVAQWPTKGFVADTEMHVFEVWSKFKYAEVSPIISQLLNTQHFDHYFLCAPDIPWEADPFRENPHDRLQLFEMYQNVLEENKRRYTILAGSFENRQELVRIEILSLMNV